MASVAAIDGFMKAKLKILSALIFALLVVAAPFVLIVTLFGLAGSTAEYHLLILAGYAGLLAFSLTGIFRPNYVFFSAIPLALLVAGVMLDGRFWTKHNATLCVDLRKEPSCIESACGFTCSNWNGAGFTTAGTICADKDMSLCR